jgi:hypothetical protein
MLASAQDQAMLAPPHALADWLGDSDEVALAVVEERAELAGALARVVVGGSDRVAASLEALEGHPPGSQLGQGRLEVLDLEGHLGRCPRRCSCRAEEMELGRPAHVAQAPGALLDWLESELVAVEGTRPLQILSGELGDGVSVAEWSGHGRLLLLGCADVVIDAPSFMVFRRETRRPARPKCERPLQLLTHGTVPWG